MQTVLRAAAAAAGLDRSVPAACCLLIGGRNRSYPGRLRGLTVSSVVMWLQVETLGAATARDLLTCVSGDPISRIIPRS